MVVDMVKVLLVMCRLDLVEVVVSSSFIEPKAELRVTVFSPPALSLVPASTASCTVASALLHRRAACGACAGRCPSWPGALAGQ